jgi:hypothetical protein
VQITGCGPLHASVPSKHPASEASSLVTSLPASVTAVSPAASAPGPPESVVASGAGTPESGAPAASLPVLLVVPSWLPPSLELPLSPLEEQFIVIPATTTNATPVAASFRFMVQLPTASRPPLPLDEKSLNRWSTARRRGF